MVRIVYLDGVFLNADSARISPFDRGFLFADAVYEVTAVMNGRPVDLVRHLDRLERSMRELGFTQAPDRAALEAMHLRLIADNAIAEGMVYLQATRGAHSGRDFVPPAETRPTVFAYAESRPLIGTAARDGVAVVSVQDIRWARRDIKTTQLLAQCLAKMEAKARGAADAWLVDGEGWVNEAASANAWIVTAGGELVTRQLSHAILAGITRAAVMDEAGASGARIVERPFTLDEAKAAREAFSTSATALVQPVIAIDGAPVGDGRPGPVTRAVQRAYYAGMGAAAPDWLA